MSNKKWNALFNYFIDRFINEHRSKTNGLCIYLNISRGYLSHLRNYGKRPSYDKHKLISMLLKLSPKESLVFTWHYLHDHKQTRAMLQDLMLLMDENKLSPTKIARQIDNLTNDILNQKPNAN